MENRIGLMFFVLPHCVAWSMIDICSFKPPSFGSSISVGQIASAWKSSVRIKDNDSIPS